jgi:hypothetical protein
MATTTTTTTNTTTTQTETETTTASTKAEIPNWKATGDWFDVCKCNIPCPCEFAQTPTYFPILAL